MFRCCFEALNTLNETLCNMIVRRICSLINLSKLFFSTSNSIEVSYVEKFISSRYYAAECSLNQTIWRFSFFSMTISNSNAERSENASKKHSLFQNIFSILIFVYSLNSTKKIVRQYLRQINNNIENYNDENNTIEEFLNRRFFEKFVTSLWAYVYDIMNDTSKNSSNNENEAVELITNLNFELSRKEYFFEYAYSEHRIFKKLNARLIEN